MLQKKWFRPKAVIGFWPANAIGDDIRLFTDESRDEELATFYTLRQQLLKRDGRPNMALADFVAPSSNGKPDYVGGFVVTAGIGEAEISENFERANDDYSAILVKALADRFAEAFAEVMHERVRKEFWGYAAGRDAHARRADRRRPIAASALPRAIRRSPTTPRRRRCSACSTPSSGSASS